MRMLILLFYLQIRQLPESVIVETTEYKCLQSQFSVLYNESMQLKTQLDEARLQLQTSKNAHLRQIEMMEVRDFLLLLKVCSILEIILCLIVEVTHRIGLELDTITNKYLDLIFNQKYKLVASTKKYWLRSNDFTSDLSIYYCLPLPIRLYLFI